MEHAATVVLSKAKSLKVTTAYSSLELTVGLSSKEKPTVTRALTVATPALPAASARD
jgi:hypothetical protein